MLYWVYCIYIYAYDFSENSFQFHSNVYLQYGTWESEVIIDSLSCIILILGNMHIDNLKILNFITFTIQDNIKYLKCKI